MKILWLIIQWLNSVKSYWPITVYMLYVHKIKDQNPTDIKLDAIKK